MTVEDVAAVRAAIDAMCRQLQKSVPAGTVFDCKLVARELLVNALRYGGGAAEFTYECGEGRVVICVRGARGFRPPEKVAAVPPDAERGRGLFLVDALSISREYSSQDGIRVAIEIPSKNGG